MNPQIEKASCPLCRSAALTRKSFNFDPYRVVQCAECSLWYLNPRMPEKDLMGIYKEDTYYEGGSAFGYGYDKAEAGYDIRSLSIRVSSQVFLKSMQAAGMMGGRLLEVGCGYGYFLDEAKRYFKEVTGLDFSPKAVRQTQKLGISAIEGGIDNIPQGRQFEVIAASNVIEHVYEPTLFLKKLLTHLAPGGWLILSTPRMNSFWQKLLGRRWPSFLIPEHVTYYDEHTLKDLYARVGIQEVRPLPGSYVFPLKLVGQKAGVKIPDWIHSINVWIPWVMISLGGRR